MSEPNVNLHPEWEPVSNRSADARCETWLMRHRESGAEQARHRFEIGWEQSGPLFSRLLSLTSIAAGCPHLESIQGVQRWDHCLELWTSVYETASLRDWASRGELRLEGLLAALVQAAKALDLMHAGGLAHGLVEPANLLWDGQRVILARACHLSPIELPEGPQGAVGYLAPECVNGSPASAASDQFQLALSYLELRTGSNPLLPNQWSMLSGLEPVPVQGLGTAETAVLRRALDAHPALRWSSTAQMAAELARACGVDAHSLRCIATEDPPVKAEPAPEAISLAEYRALLAGSTRPSPAMVDDFVGYVAGKHSWYKHLPLAFPGRLFQFFLDPVAGMQWVTDADGRRYAEEIGEHTPLFHYSMMPTRRYRDRFGHLCVQTRAAPSFSLHGSGRRADFGDRPGLWVDGRWLAIPLEVQEAGQVELTGIIHDLGSDLVAWRWMLMLNLGQGPLNEDLAAELAWPEESGGRAVLEQILHLVSDQSKHAERHARLKALIQPERERQFEQMRQSVNRVLDLVYADTISLQRRLLEVCDLQMRRERESGYDVDVGLIAVGAARGRIERISTALTPAAYRVAAADTLFALLDDFDRNGPSGEYASAASSMGSLIRRIATEMGQLDPQWREELDERWES